VAEQDTDIVQHCWGGHRRPLAGLKQGPGPRVWGDQDGGEAGVLLNQLGKAQKGGERRHPKTGSFKITLTISALQCCKVLFDNYFLGLFLLAQG